MKEGLLGGLLGRKIAQALFEGNESFDEKMKEIKNEKNYIVELDHIEGKTAQY